MSNKQTVGRRAAVKSFAGILAGVIAGPGLFNLLQSCEDQKNDSNWSPIFFNDHQKLLVTEIADLIIPETDTPSASVAGVPIFIDQFLGKCLPEKFQKVFTDGLKKVDGFSKTKYDKAFLNISKNNQIELLTLMENEDHLSNKKESFFKMLKDLVLTGYFKSKIGATQALTFVEIPMDYNGCIPLENGQRSWGE